MTYTIQKDTMDMECCSRDFEAECPVRATVRLLGGKYKSVVIWRLMDGPKRFGELRTFFSGITAHILSLQLKELESDGLIRREVKSENPPWVEYSLTSTGMSLLPVIDAIAEWGAAYIDMENEKAKLSGSSRSPE